jgi:predicted transcriptional regulator YheO
MGMKLDIFIYCKWYFCVSYEREIGTFMTTCSNGVHLRFFANRWRMRSISYYIRNTSESINNVINVNYDIDLYIFV